jgi:predicted aldo/keto reductase-like oxidoreductase
MTVARAMEIHGELFKLREERITRFLGLSAHSYFDKALALISTGAFDLCMLAYGYLPRGHDQIFSARMVALRDACLAKAHELGMDIAAMKVVGGSLFGAWSRLAVPGFDQARLAQLTGAAIRHVLDDERGHLLVIGMRLAEELDANIETLTRDRTYTAEDRALLARFSPKAFESDAIKRMRRD